MGQVFSAKRRHCALIFLASFFVFLVSSSSVPAQETDKKTPTVESRLEAAETAVKDAALAGHNAWMLTSCALVLFMTAPGLAMFYGGLVRKKNVLGVMMQCIFLMGIMTVLWALYGYSLAFGDDKWSNGFLGGTEYLFMQNVSHTWDESSKSVTSFYYADGTPARIPLLTHMLFQGMFFIITPALICGAFAERMKFSSMVIFSVLWGTLVYCPLCHAVWDGGHLAFVTTENMAKGEGKGILGGSLDFAGGAVVHISSGVSALICALVIGKRLGAGSEPMPPHNLTYTALGAAMLWFGWFGFNAGSELASDGVASSAFAATHFAAAAGTITWAVLEWILRGKPSILGAASGAVAGLVCITPAAGFVSTMPALLFGVAGGTACFFACTTLKNTFKYDDSLDAFGVHGVGGTLGALLTGVFASRVNWNIDNSHELGMIEGSSRIMVGQVVAVAITWIFSIVATFILLKLIDAVIGLRVKPDDEVQGLDVSQHGEEGYIFL